MNNRRKFALVIAIGLTCAAAPGTASASFPGKNGNVIFSTSAPLGNDCDGPNCDRGPLVVVNPRTGGVRRFLDACATAYVCVDRRPSYSPNGSQLSYTRQRDGSLSILFADLRGAPLRSLPDLGGALTFAPAAVNSTLLLEKGVRINGPNTGSDLFLTDTQGNARRRLTFRGAEKARWSTRNQIVYERRKDNGTPALYIVPAFGGPERLFLRAAQDADWSPDGKKLVFSRYFRGRDQRDRTEVVVADVRSHRLRRLTYRGGGYPVWSPDNRKIAFVRGHRIFIVPSSGRGRPVVSRAVRTDPQQLDWQPRR